MRLVHHVVPFATGELMIVKVRQIGVGLKKTVYLGGGGGTCPRLRLRVARRGGRARSRQLCGADFAGVQREGEVVAEAHVRPQGRVLKLKSD